MERLLCSFNEVTEGLRYFACDIFNREYGAKYGKVSIKDFDMVDISVVFINGYEFVNIKINPNNKKYKKRDITVKVKNTVGLENVVDVLNTRNEYLESVDVIFITVSKGIVVKKNIFGKVRNQGSVMGNFSDDKWYANLNSFIGCLDELNGVLLKETKEGKWVYNQIQLYKRGKLLPYRAEALVKNFPRLFEVKSCLDYVALTWYCGKSAKCLAGEYNIHLLYGSLSELVKEVNGVQGSEMILRNGVSRMGNFVKVLSWGITDIGMLLDYIKVTCKSVHDIYVELKSIGVHYYDFLRAVMAGHNMLGISYDMLVFLDWVFSGKYGKVGASPGYLLGSGDPLYIVLLGKDEKEILSVAEKCYIDVGFSKDALYDYLGVFGHKKMSLSGVLERYGCGVYALRWRFERMSLRLISEFENMYGVSA